MSFNFPFILHPGKKIFITLSVNHIVLFSKSTFTEPDCCLDTKLCEWYFNNVKKSILYILKSLKKSSVFRVHPATLSLESAIFCDTLYIFLNFGWLSKKVWIKYVKILVFDLFVLKTKTKCLWFSEHWDSYTLLYRKETQNLHFYILCLDFLTNSK